MMDLEEFRAELEKPLSWYKNLRYILIRWSSKPGEWIFELRQGWQRARRGYSTSDAWSFAYYLSGVIAGGVRTLKGELHGHPNEMTQEEWEGILETIIAGFEAARRLEYHTPRADRERDYAAFEEGMRLFAKHYFDLWD